MRHLLPPREVVLSLAVAAIVCLPFFLVAVPREADRDVALRNHILATNARLDALSSAVAALDEDIHAAHRRIDEAAKTAHDRRAALAAELRREIAAAAAPLGAEVADLSARLDAESGVRALVCESLFEGLDGLRITLALLADEVERLKARKPEVVRHETTKVVERVVEKQPVYVQPVYYYLMPTAVCR